MTVTRRERRGAEEDRGRRRTGGDPRVTGGVQNIGRDPRAAATHPVHVRDARGLPASAPTSRRRASTRQVIKQLLRPDGAARVFGLFNLFSGGALEQLSIFALGIMPYISASIIFQLLTIVIPSARGAEEGRRAGPAQDHPVHALRHDRARALPEPADRDRARERPVRRGRRGRSRLGLPADDDDHAHHGHGLHHVARRADHRARHRQRHLAGDLRGHRRAASRARSAQLFELVRTDQFTHAQARSCCSAFVVADRRASSCFVERGQRRIPIQHARRVVGRQDDAGRA